MFRKSNIKADTYEEKISVLKEKIQEADAVIIGAGAGLSTSAGYVYGGERFNKYFSDFIEKYHYTDEYSAGFMVASRPENEYWAFWSRNIYLNRYMKTPKPVYEELLEIVKDKDYFVITTNVDHCFQKAGFDKHRLFYTQGDYGLWQCSRPCHQKTYDNEEVVKKMVLAQGFTIADDGELLLPESGNVSMTVPDDLIPRCPVCGESMSLNLRADETFVQDDGWFDARERMEAFLSEHGVQGQFGFIKGTKKPVGKKNQNIVYLELGVGGNTPGIIKYPFWQKTYQASNATYAIINYGEAVTPREIENQSICIDGDIGTVLKKLI